MSLDKNSIIGVVGAGVMGRGIAQVAAKAGHRVILYDNFDGAVDNAMSANEKELSRLVQKGKISEDFMIKTISMIEPTMEIKKLAPCDLVIEAIIENKEIKQKIFKELEEICSDVVIASNTSSISISALANGLKYPQKLIGIHFFNPAPIMKLVEIIEGLQSDKTLVKEAHTLINSWGKKAVFVKSSPGFIVNRIARPFYAEALRLYEEGVGDFALLDESIKSGGKFRMGAFELMDLIGNDTNYAVTCSTFDSYYQDSRFKPSITQKEFVDAGLLGRKSGQGFYMYSDGKKVAKPISYVKPSNIQIDKIEICGSLGIASSLIGLFEKAGIHVTQSDGDGHIKFNNINLYLADGQMASQKALHVKENCAQFDICLDYENTDSITIATALQATQETKEHVAALFNKIGKKTLHVKDSPALITLRTIVMIINEASATVTNGVCDEASADVAMENGVNYPIGPFKCVQKLDITHVLNTLDNLESFYQDTRYRADRGLMERYMRGATQ